MDIVGCFLEYNGRFVILFRRSHKPEGDTWGLPGGKVESGENIREAMVRELQEETGYRATDWELRHIGDYEFVSATGTAYKYITFKVILQYPHQVRLEDAAHAKFQWVTAGQCNAKPDLISSFHELLKLTGYIV